MLGFYHDVSTKWEYVVGRMREGEGGVGVCNAAGGPCKGGRPCDVSIDVSRCVIITAAAAAAHYSSNNSNMAKYSMHRSYSSPNNALPSDYNSLIQHPHYYNN